LALFFSFFLSSNVLAAYASFLWETEENEEDSTSQFQIPNHHEGAAAAANA
jgi:nucleoside recognition membrane protein YjiH